MPVLARAWQMLLKGLEEVQTAPDPAQAAQMVLIRLAYVADLPVPADLVRTLTSGPQAAIPSPASAERIGVRGAATEAAQPPSAGPGVGAGPSVSRPLPDPSPIVGEGRAGAIAGEGLAPVSSAAVAPALVPVECSPTAQSDPMPQSFAETVALFEKRREAVIAAHLKANIHLVSFEPGRIEIRPTDAAPANLTNQLGQLLGEWTGTRWVVAISQAEGAPSLAEEEAARASVLRHEVASHPLVRAVLESFPGATISAVRERFGSADVENEAVPDEIGDDGASPEEDGS
jgi:DNA polymerase-3 subunit gamma/tau